MSDSAWLLVMVNNLKRKLILLVRLIVVGHLLLLVELGLLEECLPAIGYSLQEGKWHAKDTD